MNLLLITVSISKLFKMKAPIQIWEIILILLLLLFYPPSQASRVPCFYYLSSPIFHLFICSAFWKIFSVLPWFKSQSSLTLVNITPFELTCLSLPCFTVILAQHNHHRTLLNIMSPSMSSAPDFAMVCSLYFRVGANIFTKTCRALLDLGDH